MDADEPPRSFDERALWASVALELLAKAALSRVSPLLVAEPTEEGTNLLIATGLLDGEAHFSSVTATTLYSRCHKAFKPFNKREALAISRARNEYLHGAGIGFTAIPPEAWWPRFWAQAEILVTALDRELDDLVGTDRTSTVKDHLTQNAKNIENRVEMLLSRAKQRLAQHRSGGLPAKVAQEWSRPIDLTAALTYSCESACPACGEPGTLEGEDIQASEIRTERVSEDDVDAWVDLTVGSDYFSCSNCRLALEGYELLEHAGVPTEFNVVGDYGDYTEPDYGND